MRRILFAALIALIAAGASLLRPDALYLSATTPEYTAAIPMAQTAADRGIVAFAYGDWGALTSHALEVSALPRTLAEAALALQATGGDTAAAATLDLAPVYRQWGMLTPATLANWPAHIPQPASSGPLGQTTGTASRIWPPIEVTIGNAVCAQCHSSVTYDAAGQPDTSRAWLGMGNTSINLEGYTMGLFTAFRDADDAALMEVALARFPDTSLRERLTLRYAVLPRLRATVAERDAQYGSFLPFRLSTVGATNGLDSLRNRLDLIPEGTVVTQSTFNSLPDLGDRLLRRRLLLSGSYALPDPDRAMTPADVDDTHRGNLAAMIAYFTVPAMGVSPAVAQDHWDQARDVVAWLETYRPQPFPGQVDPAGAAQGQTLYADRCAACHGTYDDSLTAPRLTRFPNWHGQVGTDPERSTLVTQDFADAANATLFGEFRAVTVTGYAAPPLSGLWATAPYLHNGSVPTLWHLLTPDARPARFMAGGHAIDLKRVGIAGETVGDGWLYPDGYSPWSTPMVVDTADFGMSAAGHEAEVQGLDDAQKAALIEYLKLL